MTTRKFPINILKAAIQVVHDAQEHNYDQSVMNLKNELDPNAGCSRIIMDNMFTIVTKEHTVRLIGRIIQIVNHKDIQSELQFETSPDELVDLLISKMPYMLIEYVLKSRSSRSTCQITNLFDDLKADIERQLFLGDSLGNFSSQLRNEAIKISNLRQVTS